MHEKLKPCPFCGSEVQMGDLFDEDERRFWVREITCEVCELTMRDWVGFPPRGVPFDRHRMSFEVGEALTEKWNRRPDP